MPAASQFIKYQAHKIGSDMRVKVDQAADEAARLAFVCASDVIAPEVMVERVTGTLKDKLNKTCAASDLNWIDVLTLAQMYYCMQTNRMTNLVLHDMLTGGLMPVLKWRGTFDVPSMEQLERELK
ncbi:hypothetical protein chiPu_0021063 [Chiloscyllium punctatum]|uniref:Uncharacterized protein n=1 Tax=Chiloscyllium punctatum TaxID=137246 RepID=A0A401RMS1_CHIPU|nr:hypothetical protein [Chiloscyllium punctatum]